MAERISIVIAAEVGAVSVERCLSSLPTGETVEVRVVRPAAAPGPAERPGMTLHRLDGKPTRMALRAAGIAAAQGDAVAVLNEDYTVAPGWLEAVRASADPGVEVVCGEVDPPDGAGLATRAAYLWEYSHLLPPAPQGRLHADQARWIPAGCAVYRGRAREAKRFRDSPNELECHARMAADGIAFCRDARLRTVYNPPPLSEFLAARRSWSREWARRDVPPGPVEWLRLAALGPLLFARTVARVASRPAWLVTCVLAAPLFAAFAAMQVLGELDALLASDPE